MKSEKVLRWIGAMVFVIAWFLPVHKDGTTLSKGSFLPGLEALLTALSSSSWLYSATAVTNILVPISIILLAKPNGRRHAVTIGGLLLIAAALDSSWFFAKDIRWDLRIGYYLWVASFLILAAAAFWTRTEREKAVERSTASNP